MNEVKPLVSEPTSLEELDELLGEACEAHRKKQVSEHSLEIALQRMRRKYERGIQSLETIVSSRIDLAFVFLLRHFDVLREKGKIVGKNATITLIKSKAVEVPVAKTKALGEQLAVEALEQHGLEKYVVVRKEVNRSLIQNDFREDPTILDGVPGVSVVDTYTVAITPTHEDSDGHNLPKAAVRFAKSLGDIRALAARFVLSP